MNSVNSNHFGQMCPCVFHCSSWKIRTINLQWPAIVGLIATPILCCRSWGGKGSGRTNGRKIDLSLFLYPPLVNIGVVMLGVCSSSGLNICLVLIIIRVCERLKW